MLHALWFGTKKNPKDLWHGSSLCCGNVLARVRCFILVIGPLFSWGGRTELTTVLCYSQSVSSCMANPTHTIISAQGRV